MRNIAPGLYTPDTPAPSLYVVNGLDAVVPDAGGEARFLHVRYMPPVEGQWHGTLGFATLNKRVDNPLVNKWVGLARSFRKEPMGVIRITNPDLNLTPLEDLALDKFVRDYADRDGVRPWMTGEDTTKVFPDATSIFAIGSGKDERVYHGVRHDNLAVAAISAIVLKRLTIDNN